MFEKTDKRQKGIIITLVVLSLLNVAFLGHLTDRLIASVLVIAGFGTYLFYISQYKLTHFSPNQQFFHELKRRVSEIFRTIPKKSTWVLLLGPSGSGKSRLLAHSGLKLSTIHIEAIDCWIGKSVVFIDPAGKYALSTPSDTNNFNYWNYFLRLLRRKRRTLFDEILLTIDLPRLLDPEHLSFKQLIKRIHTQLLFLNQFNPQAKVTLVITHCDRMRGFTDFFNDLGTEERQQPFGFALNDNIQKFPLPEWVNQRFNAFIKLISDRLFWRLHHERSLSKRYRLKDVPFQFEKLQLTLSKLISEFSGNLASQLQGIYFTSGFQEGEPLNLLVDKFSQSKQISLLRHQKKFINQYGFFIQDLVKSLIVPHPARLRINWQRSALYLCSALLLVGVVGIWRNLQEHQAHVSLPIMANTQHIDSKKPWLENLNALYQAKMTGNQKNIGWHRWVDFGKTERLQQQANIAYQKGLTDYFIPYLNKVMTNELTSEIQQKKPSNIYNALAIYLMLSNPKQVKSEFVLNWFDQLWQHQFPEKTTLQQQLLNHLKNFLTLNLSLPTDNRLIDQARNTLREAPIQNIVFTILRDQFNASINITEGMNVPTFLNASNATLSILYSSKESKEIYQVIIPNIVQAIAKNNWVVGDIYSEKVTPQTEAKWIRKLQLLYLKNYAAAWESALDNIQLKPIKSYSDLGKFSDQFTNIRSELWSFINNLVKIEPAGILSRLNEMTQQNISYQMTSKTLNVLKSGLVTTYPEKSAFEFTAQRFKNNGKEDSITQLRSIAKILPTPINHWINTVTDSSWALCLSDARIYIDKMWKKQILPVYNRDIKNRYPIFIGSKQEISIKSFNQFFGPGGILQHFFTNYLEPFTNTDLNYWQWKKLEGKTISMSQPSLDALLRASIIQKMFYANNFQNPSVKFSLTPLSFSPNIHRCTLNFGGQLNEFTPNEFKTVHLTWPDSDKNLAGLGWITTNEVKHNRFFKGPWAWYHLLNQAIVQPTKNPKRFKVTFRLGHDEMQYQLIANNPANPFLPDLLYAFRCPESLQ